jgi:alcohol dehydrogenase class IV
MSQVRKFEMARVETVIQGVGAVHALAEEMDKRKLTRTVVVTGRTVGSSQQFAELLDELDPRVAGVFREVKAHNPVDSVLDLIHYVREAGADSVLGIGGGSPIDAAKMAAVGVAEGVETSDDFARNYLQFEYPDKIQVKPLSGVPVPVLAIPTTLSAAEWDGFAGTVDQERDTKELVVYLEATPRVVLLDPEFASHTPRDLWAQTGVRALDHAVETSYAKNAHPYTTALANASLSLLAKHLPSSVKDPSDYESALQCQQAAWMSIIGVHNVSLGLSHAIGHQLGALGIPHGATSCIMLPTVMRFLEPVTSQQQAEMAASIAAVQGDAHVVSAADRLEGILNELGVPRRVSDFGIGRDKMAGVATAALGDVVVRESPRPVDEDAIFALLEEVW